MVGVVMRSSWKCNCRRAEVGPTNDPAVILSCCHSPRCHQESDAGRFQYCRDYLTNRASNVTPNPLNYPIYQTGEQGLWTSSSTPGVSRLQTSAIKLKT